MCNIVVMLDAAKCLNQQQKKKLLKWKIKHLILNKLPVKGIYLIASDLDKCFVLKLAFEMHKWFSMAVKPFAIKDDFQIQPLEFQSSQSVLFGISCVMSGNYLPAVLPRLNGALEKV